MSIHEYGDEALRPTSKAWICLNCGVKLYTVSCIESHKARCNTKKESKREIREKEIKDLREKELIKNIKIFKEKNGIDKNERI
jgi:hypothetical protein